MRLVIIQQSLNIYLKSVEYDYFVIAPLHSSLKILYKKKSYNNNKKEASVHLPFSHLCVYSFKVATLFFYLHL